MIQTTAMGALSILWFVTVFSSLAHGDWAIGLSLGLGAPCAIALLGYFILQAERKHEALLKTEQAARMMVAKANGLRTGIPTEAQRVAEQAADDAALYERLRRAELAERLPAYIDSINNSDIPD